MVIYKKYKSTELKITKLILRKLNIYVLNNYCQLIL